MKWCGVADKTSTTAGDDGDVESNGDVSEEMGYNRDFWPIPILQWCARISCHHCCIRG